MSVTAGRRGAAANGHAMDPEVSERWDAGMMGCGDLVIELRRRMRAMSAGGVLLLVAEDPGAPADIPAWCGMTGHALLAARHPEYWIRRRDSD